MTMKCELCAGTLPEGIFECVECSKPESRAKIEMLFSETIRFLEKDGTANGGHELHFSIGNFHRLAGRYDEAIASYERAIEGNPSKAEYYRSLGTAYAAKREYKAAVEAIKKARDLAPKYADYHNDLGAAYFKTARYDEAIACFEEALRLNPRYANAHNNFAFACRKKGLYEKAAAHVKKAIEIDPAHAIAGYDLGLSYFSGGMFSQLRDALSIDAKAIGDIYRLREMYTEAASRYETAATIHPNYPDIHYALGLVHAKLGNARQAAASLEKALALNPNYTAAREELARVEKQSGGTP